MSTLCCIMEVRLLAIVSNIVIPAYLFLYESPESEGVPGPSEVEHGMLSRSFRRTRLCHWVRRPSCAALRRAALGEPRPGLAQQRPETVAKLSLWTGSYSLQDSSETVSLAKHEVDDMMTPKCPQLVWAPTSAN